MKKVCSSCKISRNSEGEMTSKIRSVILVSGSHRTGDPHEVHLAGGVLKQVQHDIGGGIKSLSFPIQDDRKIEYVMGRHEVSGHYPRRNAWPTAISLVLTMLKYKILIIKYL